MRSKSLLASDTSARAERILVERWRCMTGPEKARAVTAITLAAQELSLAGIRIRHPGASDRECLLRLAALKLGHALACKIYPEAAALLGR